MQIYLLNHSENRRILSTILGGSLFQIMPIYLLLSYYEHGRIDYTYSNDCPDEINVLPGHVLYEPELITSYEAKRQYLNQRGKYIQETD